MRPLRLNQLSRHNKIPLSWQIARFAIVGVINTTVDLAVLNTVILVTSRGRSGVLYSVFKTISFAAAVGNSYFLNSRWTFSQPVSQTSSHQAGRFLSVSLLGLATNVGLASWIASLSRFASLGGFSEVTKYWPSLAALAGSCCSLAFNFLGYKYLVFSRSPGSATMLRQRTHSAVGTHEPALPPSCLSVEEARVSPTLLSD
jgi:putative flippase GtrA